MDTPKKYYREVIVSNKAHCLLCDTVIESTHGHDFKTCPCGNLSVDGGKNYLRRAYSSDKLLEFTLGHPPGERTWVDVSETYQEEREPYEWELRE